MAKYVMFDDGDFRICNSLQEVLEFKLYDNDEYTDEDRENFGYHDLEQAVKNVKVYELGKQIHLEYTKESVKIKK